MFQEIFYSNKKKKTCITACLPYKFNLLKKTKLFLFHHPPELTAYTTWARLITETGIVKYLVYV